MLPRWANCLEVRMRCVSKSINIGLKMAESVFGHLTRQTLQGFWVLNLILNHDIVSPTFRINPPEIFNQLHL